MSFSIKNSKKNQIGQKRQLGQGMTEYIIIVALVAVTAIGVYSMFGKTIRLQVAGITNELGGTTAAKQTEEAKATGVKATTIANKNTTLGNYNETATSEIK